MRKRAPHVNTSASTGNHCLRWRKSSYSAGEGQCVEVAASGGLVRLRESDDPGAVVSTAPAAWAAFVRSVKAGAFDA
jgi:hypothetical protein